MSVFSAFWAKRVSTRPFHFERSGKSMGHIELGACGEKMAVSYLRARGFKVLYRNYRGPRGGELDIVARDRDVLCFIEVKTRRKRSGSRPLDAVHRAKQELIERGANAWLNLLPNTDFLWRFDVIEVILEEGVRPHVVHVQDAF